MRPTANMEAFEAGIVNSQRRHDDCEAAAQRARDAFQPRVDRAKAAAAEADRRAEEARLSAQVAHAYGEAIKTRLVVYDQLPAVTLEQVVAAENDRRTLRRLEAEVPRLDAAAAEAELAAREAAAAAIRAAQEQGELAESEFALRWNQLPSGLEQRLAAPKRRIA